MFGSRRRVVPVESAPSRPVPVRVHRERTAVAPPLVGDRCDQCGVPAMVAFLLPQSRVPLMLCGHHFQDHEQVILAVATAIARHPTLKGTR